MAKKSDTAYVKLWGDTVGAVSWLEDLGYAIFEYDPNFIKKGLNISPVHMNLERRKFSFPALNVELAQEIMNERMKLDVDLDHPTAIKDILRIGTSAGGARPKAIIAMNNEGNILSGQAQVPEEYEYWILKFDGVTDLELGEPRGYGRIEYAYHLMAKVAGIEMTECRLLEENGRAHFMTKRFDRMNGQKLHMQSLCGIAHYDFNMAGAYSYEQAFLTMQKLEISQSQIVQQYRRMLFNVIARNMDDHTKNISFLMDSEGKWKLSPAYDVTYSHNPHGKWTNQHQMSLNGKRDHFTLSDLLEVGKLQGILHPEIVIQEVMDAVLRWPSFAKQAEVNEEAGLEIGRYHRTKLF